MSRTDLAAFFKQEHQRLVRYVRSWLQAAADLDAEDIINDVFLHILEKADISLPLEDFAAYIYCSLKNRVIDYFRTKKPAVSLQAQACGQGRSLLQLLRDARPDALRDLQTREGKELLFRALGNLSDIEREVVVANELEGMTFSEMAATRGVSINTLLSHKARAMKKLKDLLQDD